jgi:hypothetical protein
MTEEMAVEVSATATGAGSVTRSGTLDGAAVPLAAGVMVVATMIVPTVLHQIRTIRAIKLLETKGRSPLKGLRPFFIFI